ncbi:hypothetical protein J6590_107701, partial [Homalodisca vitripennis]
CELQMLTSESEHRASPRRFQYLVHLCPLPLSQESQTLQGRDQRCFCSRSSWLAMPCPLQLYRESQTLHDRDQR